MGKQKQIVEIENMLEDFRTNRIACGCEYLANMIYDKLISQDSVVLSREEFWKLSNKFSRKELDDISQFRVNKARNEMAEKIGKELRIFINKCRSIIDVRNQTCYIKWDITLNYIYELAKSLGAEIKE